MSLAATHSNSFPTVPTERQDMQKDQQQEQLHGKLQICNLPAHVIGQNIGPFLDRQSFNALRVTCHEVLNSLKGISSPWPHVRLPAGSSNKLGLQSIAFSPDGCYFACRGRGGMVRIWNQQDGKQLGWVCRGPFRFGNITFSMDNKTLACDGSDMRILLYDVSTGSYLQSLRGHRGAITRVAYSPVDQQMLASSSTDSSIILWHRSQPHQHHPQQQQQHEPVADESSDESCGDDGSDGDDSEEVEGRAVERYEQVVLTGHVGTVHSIAWSPNGQYLASAGADRVVRVWNVPKVIDNIHHEFCQTLRGHEMVVVDVAFSDKILASASLDMTIRLWSKRCHGSSFDHRYSPKVDDALFCHRIIQLDSEALTISISRDGNTLGVGTTTGRISLWNLAVQEDEDKDDDGLLSENQSQYLTEESNLKPERSFPGRLIAFGPDIMATAGKSKWVQLHAREDSKSMPSSS